MQQPIQADYRRFLFIHSLIQLGLVAAALTLTLGSLIATQNWGQKKHGVRAACALIGVGLALIADQERQDKKWAKKACEQIDNAIAHNAATWAHALTCPSETSMRIIDAQTIEPEIPSLFDWGELVDADAHPTFVIFAPMGGGKSYTAKWLAKHVLFPNLNPIIRAIDIYAKDNEWNGANEIKVPEYEAMLELLTADIEDIDDRVGQYRKGKVDFQPVFTIFEETPNTIKTLTRANKDAVTAWLDVMTTVARKVRHRTMFVSVKMTGEGMGVPSEVRDNATVIFVGSGVDRAMTDDRVFKLGAKQNAELKKSLQLALTGFDPKRRALINVHGQWYPARIPELDAEGNPTGYQPQALPQQQTIEVKPESDRDRLDRQFYYDAEFNVEPDPELESLKRELEGLGTKEPEWMPEIRRLKATHKEYFDALCEAIVKTAEKQSEPVKAAHITQNYRALRSFNGDEIRTVFLLLEHWGKGQTVGEGKERGFTLN